MLKIRRTVGYYQSEKDLLDSNPELWVLISKRVFWFAKNNRDTRLKDHALVKRLKGKRAFSIDDDLRIVFEVIGKNEVRFLAIGGHEKVYRKKLVK
jgi:mRNA-degrading endonuclease YafQ of YafQ-DinJ toxin-antitoxin module